MKRLILLALLCVYAVSAQETLTLDYYLPKNVSYDPTIPKPQSVIGHEVGEWHVTHDKLVEYMKVLAAASGRIILEDRGKTYEGRPLLLLTITSERNHQRLEEIKQEHKKLSTAGGSGLNTVNMPVIVYQGFSIHGNEPSGSNAALAVAYYLAAAQGSEIEKLLESAVILFDPSFNPDGLQRFAYWANSNKSFQPNPDSNEREYHEVWPGGRTNHYWFDMNRDWLPAQLPESQTRITSFHEWLPNILTDHHEMGTNSTFFFQPGEPMRVHPLTPKLNQQLTARIGEYHARALNQIGSLYYSEENYDDFYYGKGSTFPDINGGIGILFEQASSRGHLQESDNGILTFPFTIRNQFTTALSTLKAALELRVDLLNYQRDFYAQNRAQSIKDDHKVVIFGDEKDAAKTYHLAEILKRQHIEVHHISEDAVINGKSFKKGFAYTVPYRQKNYGMLKAMFEKRTRFQDSLFYDVSAWTFPLAFNVDYTEVNSLSSVGDKINTLSPISGAVNKKSEYAYLFEWNEYYTPKALNKILNKGLRAKVAMEPFSLEGNSFDYGTVMVPVQNQKLTASDLYAFLSEVAKECGLRIKAIGSGLAKGIDLGSNRLRALKPVKVAMLVGNGIASYDAGEIWHLFDQRFDMVITKIDVSYMDRVDLNAYTTIIVPSSRGKISLSERSQQTLKDWVKNGGTLIGYRNAVSWLKQNKFIDLTFKKHEQKIQAKNITYEQRNDFRGAQVTGGAIFQASTDRSHPINFGYKNDKISLFRNTNIYIQPDDQSFNNPIQYTDSPLLSGYISEENLELAKNSVPFQVKRQGKGKVIVFTDNTNFRAFWYGTNKLLMNAIFFSRIM